MGATIVVVFALLVWSTPVIPSVVFGPELHCPGRSAWACWGWWDRVASRSQFHEGTVIRMFLEPEGCEYQLTIRTPEGIVTEGHEPFC
jgi:hypothetical protein